MPRRPAPPTEPVVELVDMVNRPPHYTQGEVECIDAIKSALGPEGFVAFLRGQVLKYTWRMMHKGDALENAQKGDWYNQRLIKELEDQASST